MILARSFAASHTKRARGAAMIIALALVMGLLVMIVATQKLVVAQLAASKTERDYDRALTMAEAGMNAFLNMLTNGNPANTVTNYGMIPPDADWKTFTAGGTYTWADPGPSLEQVKDWIKAGTINATSTPRFIFFPNTGTQASPSQRESGFVVARVGSATATVSLIAFGWSNGVVRRIHVPTNGAVSYNVFDWAAIYGLNSAAGNGNISDPSSGPAWSFTGSANVVGASGAEGYINGNNNVTYYDGPVILAAAGNPDNPTNPTVVAAAANLPLGHTMFTGEVLAVPAVRRLTRSLNLETADLAAHLWANSQFNAGLTTAPPGTPTKLSPGVDYFKTNHNDNNLGIRYLVKATSGANTGKVRELALKALFDKKGNSIPNTYKYVTTSNSDTGPNAATPWELKWPASGDLTSYFDIDPATESFVAIRAYPGNYYFQKISQSTQDQLWIRSYNDTDYPSGAPATTNTLPVYSSTWGANPINGDTAMASERNVRFWIGSSASSSGDPNSSFSDNTFMEYDAYSSRFRLYVASQGVMAVSGTNANPPQKFRAAMLVYNYGTMLNGSLKGQTMFYGATNITSGTYLFGSLIAWKVGVAGGCTIEKQAAEGGIASGGTGTGDRLTYVVLEWTELP